MPFGAAPRLGWTVVALVVLAAGVLWLPQLDPFGQVAAAKEEEQERQALRRSRTLTEKRIEQIRHLKADVIDDRSLEINRLLRGRHCRADAAGAGEHREPSNQFAAGQLAFFETGHQV